MTEKLNEQTCVPCRGGEPPASEAEIRQYKKEIPDWEIIEVEGVKRLQKEFKFKNFAKALDFTNRVGEIAEQQDHHPLLITEWGKVIVNWWTHTVAGLHKNDFIMASKTDQLME